MREIRKLFCTLVLVSVMMSPTIASATSNSNQENNSSYFQVFANFFSFINNTNEKDFAATTYSYYDKENKYWWDSWFDWSWDHKNEHKDDDWDWDECKDDKWGWSNDDGCIDSAEIWKKWYCF